MGPKKEMTHQEEKERGGTPGPGVCRLRAWLRARASSTPGQPQGTCRQWPLGWWLLHLLEAVPKQNRGASFLARDFCALPDRSERHPALLSCQPFGQSESRG